MHKVTVPGGSVRRGSFPDRSLKIYGRKGSFSGSDPDVLAHRCQHCCAILIVDIPRRCMEHAGIVYLQAKFQTSHEAGLYLRRRHSHSGNHVAIEMIVDDLILPKSSMQKIMKIWNHHGVVVIGYRCIEYRFHPVVGRSTSMLKIPYSWVYGIAILSYFDMIISYFYALFHGVKSEAKEAASSNE